MAYYPIIIMALRDLHCREQRAYGWMALAGSVQIGGGIHVATSMAEAVRLGGEWIEQARYVILGNSSAIICLTCGMQSFNPGDIEHHYCGLCDKFHDDQAPAASPPPGA